MRDANFLQIVPGSEVRVGEVWADATGAKVRVLEVVPPGTLYVCDENYKRGRLVSYKRFIQRYTHKEAP